MSRGVRIGTRASIPDDRFPRLELIIFGVLCVDDPFSALLLTGHPRQHFDCASRSAVFPVVTVKDMNQGIGRGWGLTRRFTPHLRGRDPDFKSGSRPI